MVFPAFLVRVSFLCVLFRTGYTFMYEIRVVHTNNIHAQLEPMTINNRQIGGVGKVISFIQSKYADRIILTNVGDIFTGSDWFRVHGGKILADVMNEMNIRFKVLGEHELIHGSQMLLEYFQKLRLRCHLCSNCNATPAVKKHIYPYDNNQGVPVHGIMHPRFNIGVDYFNFTEVRSVVDSHANAEPKMPLFEFIISHGTYSFNKRLARKLRGVRMIIGGHGDTLLYNGNDPEVTLGRRPAGEYPTIVKDVEGKPVFILHTTSRTKHVGFFEMNVTETGEVIWYEGAPVVMDDKIPESPAIKQIMDKYRPQVEELRNKFVGKSSVVLDGYKDTCRRRECNFGNLITDAMAAHMAKAYGNATSWSPVGIYLINGGAIRTGVTPNRDSKKVRFGDLSNALPFANMLVVMRLTGAELRKALEHSVSGYTKEQFEFLQVSGLRVQYDFRASVGQRVQTVLARCAGCSLVKYAPLEDNKVYYVGTIDHLSDGGDGFEMFEDKEVWEYVKHVEVLDMVVEYMRRPRMIEPVDEERILLCHSHRLSSFSKTSAVERVKLYLFFFYMLLLFLL
ncbi:NT5E [Trypoxylus dichotomus]